MHHAAHVLSKAGHVETAVLHADIHVVGPGTSIHASLRMGQHMPAVRTVIIDGLILSNSSTQRLIRLPMKVYSDGFRGWQREASMVPRHHAIGADDLMANDYQHDVFELESL